MTNNRWWVIGFAALVGLLVGVALTGWQVLPAKEMAARATCADCHDLHGAIELEEAPFQSQVWLLGDVPSTAYFFVNDLFPLANQQRGDQIALPELLARYGVTEFERVALQSLDGGLVVIERQYVTAESALVPYLEGLRFRDENQHESTWLKGVRWIIVAGAEAPLTVDGASTSLGRLMLGGIENVAEGSGQAMFKSPLDEQIYKAIYTHVHPGAPLRRALAHPGFATLRVSTTGGEVRELGYDIARDAVLIRLGKELVLALPNAASRDWVTGVASIESIP